MCAKELRQRSANALRGNWGIAILVTLIAAILCGTGNVDIAGISTGITARFEWNDLSFLQNLMVHKAGKFLLLWITGLGSVLSGLSALRFILGGAINLGEKRFDLNLIDGETVTFTDLFSQFHIFVKAFVMNLLMNLFIILWSLLFVIPGIVMGYAYSMAPFILLEHPELSGMEAIRASKRLMKGNKWRCFCLDFSFIGWMILSVLTLGVGFLWLNPYMHVAKAGFYRQIQQEWRETHGASGFNESYSCGVEYSEDGSAEFH